MVSDFSPEATRNLPLGSIANPRGCFSVGALQRYESFPLAESTLNAARVLEVRSEAYRNFPFGVRCRSAAQMSLSVLRGGGPPPRNTDNDIWAADLHLTPNGKFLYASERTSSTLAAFSVDSASGKLSYLWSAPTEKQPRGFAIDPKGRFLVASGEKSETISVYAIDPASGALKLLQKVPTGKGSNWVEIVGFD